MNVEWSIIQCLIFISLLDFYTAHSIDLSIILDAANYSKYFTVYNFGF